MKDESIQRLRWFAIRVTYSRELKLKAYLDTKGIEHFLPMQYKRVEVNGKQSNLLVPVIHNLIFIKSSKLSMDELKEQLSTQIPIRYMMDKASHQPIVVPEKEMLSFIAVAGTLNEQLLYLKEVNEIIDKGDRVRITEGIFKGVEGYVIRIKRDRRVVVIVKDIIAVATAFVPIQLLQKL